MAKAIIMPRQGQSVESCIIGEWHVKRGQQVKAGDPLFTYETDKATFDELAEDEGEVLAIFFEEGDDVPCLLNVMVIGQAGEDWHEFIPEGATADGAGEAPATGEAKPAVSKEGAAAPTEEAAAPAEASDAATDATAAAMPVPRDGERIAISPRARMLAEKRHADLRYAQGTGPEGRIIERDVQAVIDAGHLATAAAGAGYAAGIEGSGIGGRVRVADLAKEAPAAKTAAASSAAIVPVTAAQGEEYYDEKLPNIRKVIAKAMHASLSEMAQLTLHTTFDATDMLNLRKRLKAAKAAGLDEKLGISVLEHVPTINDLILYAVSRTVTRFPYCNAHFLGDKMRYFNRVHLGVAVDTPRGLMVPVVRNGDLKSVAQISREARELAEQARGGSISPDLIQGSTITITNLGTLGVDYFTPIINPPETTLVGVGGLKTEVRLVDGEPEYYQAMSLSLTIDHRVVDGAPGARYLRALKESLENISLLLMD